jgi:hypothetical protein
MATMAASTGKTSARRTDDADKRTRVYAHDGDQRLIHLGKGGKYPYQVFFF